MCTTKFVVLLIFAFPQCTLTEINVLKINGRGDSNSEEGNVRNAVFVPVELLQEDYQNTNLPDITLVRPAKTEELHNLASANPVLATLLLSYNLHILPKPLGFNHPQHLPINPYVALLLSHYGRYIPFSGQGSRGTTGRGIYGYTAANNYHNNLPFGSYKIYADKDVR